MNEIVLQEASDFSEHPSRGAYTLCLDFRPFLRVDVCPQNPLTEDELRNRSAVMLANMGFNTWEVLKTLLPSSTQALDTLRQNCRYKDLVSGALACSLYPVAIVAQSIEPYVPAGTDYEFFCQAFCQENALQYWQQEQFEYAEERPFDLLDRVATVLMGSGYTALCRPSDGGSEYQWERVDLSNGDTLLLAGLGWFND
jgi:hypothetical protein